MIKGNTYEAYLYVSDSSGGDDGTLYEPVELDIPPSNTYSINPFFGSTTIGTGVVIGFQATVST